MALVNFNVGITKLVTSNLEPRKSRVLAAVGRYLLNKEFGKLNTKTEKS